MLTCQIIEYEDDLGRTRRGTRAEARQNGARPTTEMQHPPENSAYAEVLQSNVIRESLLRLGHRSPIVAGALLVDLGAETLIYRW